LQTVKFCIIVENSCDYVSEKIFDCFKAGVVPIYVGPSLPEFGIPAETVLVAPNDINGFFGIIDNIESFPVEEILKNGEKFLNSGAHAWTEMVALANIADIIIREIEN
jgi:hypothetical protein